MKFLSSLVLLAASVAGSVIQKRACASDAAPYGYAAQNGGTTGGYPATTTVTVNSLSALTSAVSGAAKKIVYISGQTPSVLPDALSQILAGTISGNVAVNVGNNTSVIGLKGSSLVGVGLRVLNSKNVIIRNVKISKVLADAGDAIGVQASSQVWIDHVDLSSDRDHDKDYYDGLLDLTHGVTGITVTNSKLHDHWKGSLVGHSDSNGSEDTKITVTYGLNYWSNINSRTPSFRFGHGHIFNNYFVNNADGINTRDGAQLLVENCVWETSKNTVYATDAGYAVVRGSTYGNATAPSAGAGNFNTAPYSYPLIAASSVKSTVTANAGQTLTC